MLEQEREELTKMKKELEGKLVQGENGQANSKFAKMREQLITEQ